MTPKKITLEYLARMVANGFRGMDEQFEKVWQKFAQVDKRFDQVGKRFDAIELRLDGGETSHEVRLDHLEHDMRQVKTKIGVK
ncbi:MAG: hypothetical protein U9M92_00330 [Patescibacteria group bacterium]|nr:hypothetical protein [Patescibacteria group bacterium]